MAEQDGLDGSGADHAVGDAAYRPGRHVERLLSDRTAKAPESIVQYRDQPFAVDPEHRRHDQRKEHLYQAVGQSSRHTDHHLLHIRGIGLQQRAQVALDLDHAVPGRSQAPAAERQALIQSGCSGVAAKYA